MYSPTAMLKLPAMRPAMPARTTVWASPDDAPAMPMIRLTLATRPSVAPNTEGRRMLEPRVSWGLAGAARMERNLDRTDRSAARGAPVLVLRRVTGRAESGRDRPGAPPTNRKGGPSCPLPRGDE